MSTAWRTQPSSKAHPLSSSDAEKLGEQRRPWWCMDPSPDPSLLFVLLGQGSGHSWTEG